MAVLILVIIVFDFVVLPTDIITNIIRVEKGSLPQFSFPSVRSQGRDSSHRIGFYIHSIFFESGHGHSTDAALAGRFLVQAVIRQLSNITAHVVRLAAASGKHFDRLSVGITLEANNAYIFFNSSFAVAVMDSGKVWMAPIAQSQTFFMHCFDRNVFLTGFPPFLPALPSLFLSLSPLRFQLIFWLRTRYRRLFY
ncbi:unnamed protein product [Pseudo-nitzschia multistriata]|uniref:Peptidase A1 domain-containing protein n=1 Tax=Pseudo-nitzschia multistriata TaxID=183589 RepID=A0A448Z3D4_9STRA|nr:unnamed protein product [Pseudo-nitzschia multistriata]